MNDWIQLLFSKFQSVSGVLIIILVIVEWSILFFTRKIESNKEGFVNILSYVLQTIPYVFFGKVLILGTMMWVYEYRLFTLGYNWYIWVLAYFVYDFMFYVLHYIGHKVRFFWCIHGVHHTAEEMKLTVAVRGSFLIFLHMPHTVLWLPIFGFDPFMIFIIELIAALYGLYGHASEKLVGRHVWLEHILITPSLHRVHHAKNHKYLDTNYGETFSIWDRMFGTLQKELDSDKPIYGLMGDSIDSKSIWQIQVVLWTELWRDINNASKWTDKVKYIFMHPGWNHIDGGKKATEYRLEALLKDAVNKKQNVTN
ncbi:sterol desaturase family protein [Aquimarina sp. AD10]|uniref:sterol desaturase family protein n=1 Tax=Aquimarina sp. AD10 TaxID=1714849 RepID=UPI000E4D044F|nr:sterol desaturase family protein [Aquimarina sp. AD10]AXT62693.1 sterol desaturase family protein [Aquimarina sp. AD10]RKN01876.1 sterol desaturase family protein [Aquimarina sp. AD10]